MSGLLNTSLCQPADVMWKRPKRPSGEEHVHCGLFIQWGTTREFPGGPVVRTQHFHCYGPGSIPGWETKILQAARHGQKNKKTKNNGVQPAMPWMKLTNIMLAERSQTQNSTYWASLVAQWLRVCLPVQGTRVRALVWEDPTCRGAAGPVSHNC